MVNNDNIIKATLFKLTNDNIAALSTIHAAAWDESIDGLNAAECRLLEHLTDKALAGGLEMLGEVMAGRIPEPEPEPEINYCVIEYDEMEKIIADACEEIHAIERAEIEAATDCPSSRPEDAEIVRNYDGEEIQIITRNEVK